MDRSDVITLVAVKLEPNDIGALVETITERDVYVQVRSIGMKEFYQAAAVGLQPEITFVLADYYDYENERIVIYEGIRYSVIRTYRKADSVEIVCRTEVNNHANS